MMWRICATVLAALWTCSQVNGKLNWFVLKTELHKIDVVDPSITGGEREREREREKQRLFCACIMARLASGEPGSLRAIPVLPGSGVVSNLVKQTVREGFMTPGGQVVQLADTHIREVTHTHRLVCVGRCWCSWQCLCGYLRQRVSLPVVARPLPLPYYCSDHSQGGSLTVTTEEK